ncbi:MAG: YceI family protein [Verrucomicrobiota bacterium]
MKPEELKQADRLQVLDVRLADDYEAAHIAGAHNNCVYEVKFTERLPQCAPDKNAPVVVYSENDACWAAAAAADKLNHEGYRDVRVLAGGLAAAEQAHLEIIRGKPLSAPPMIADGEHQVDTEKSELRWTGRNVLNHHGGTVRIAGGSLSFRNQKLTGGHVEIDLTKIHCDDLADREMHDFLVKHLQSEDFFDVENHPRAELTVTAAREVREAAPGASDLEITADLKLRGITNEIQFTVASGITDENKAAAQAAFAIDRTKWNVRYGCGRLFHRLADHLVNDLIEFQVTLVTQ